MPPKRFYKKRTYDEANAGSNGAGAGTGAGAGAASGGSGPNRTETPQIQFDLGVEKKKVTVRKFKNMKLIDIREYYQKDNNWLPGSKGISLTEDQWNVLLSKMIDINEALHKLDDRSGMDVLKAALESKEKIAKANQEREQAVAEAQAKATAKAHEEAAAAAAASAVASQTQGGYAEDEDDDDDEDVDDVEFEDVSLVPGQAKPEL